MGLASGPLHARRARSLNYSGNGLIGLLGDVNDEYAFPAMRTVGTLTV